MNEKIYNQISYELSGLENRTDENKRFASEFFFIFVLNITHRLMLITLLILDHILMNELKIFIKLLELTTSLSYLEQLFPESESKFLPTQFTRIMLLHFPRIYFFHSRKLI